MYAFCPLLMNLICVTSSILLQDFFNEAVNFSANIDFSRSQVDESVRSKNQINIPAYAKRIQYTIACLRQQYAMLVACLALLS